MRQARQCTMLDLVCEVNQYTTTDTETVATAADLINSGKVRLCGNFSGAQIELSPGPTTVRDKPPACTSDRAAVPRPAGG
jgi:hypothetical protein